MTWPAQVLLFAIFLLAYTWIGYPVILYVRLSLRRLPPRPGLKTPHPTPSFSIIVAVHNEEARIDQKLQNCLALEYPHDAVGILATASGSAFAIRRGLFQPIPPQFGDDCTIPLDVRLQGFKAIQDAQAIVFDEMPHSIAGELRTRIRMTARNWSGILSRPALLNPFRFPGTAWGLVSHKFLRWLTPFSLMAALLSHLMLPNPPRRAALWLLPLPFYIAP